MTPSPFWKRRRQSGEIALIDSAVLAIAQQFVPLAPGQPGTGERATVDLDFRQAPQPGTGRASGSVPDQARREGLIARIEDRYLGHVRRLKMATSSAFWKKRKPSCPDCVATSSAQGETGIDWRLLAALAYRGSQWDARATSPTGVRGIMMLTGIPRTVSASAIASTLAKSIAAGARYLALLGINYRHGRRARCTWQALAATTWAPGTSMPAATSPVS